MLNKQKREVRLPVFLLLLLLDEQEIILVFGVVGTGVAGIHSSHAAVASCMKKLH